MHRSKITYRPHHCEHDDTPDGCTHEGMVDATCSECGWLDWFVDRPAAAHIAGLHAKHHATVVATTAMIRQREKAETS